MFDDDFSLDSIKDLIITLNINPEEAENAIIGFLRDNYGKDKKVASLFNNQNANISKRMNYYIDDNTWYIRVRKDKSKIFADGDFVLINLDVTNTGTNKIIFSIETRKSQLSRIKVCPMHQSRLNTKVNIAYNLQYHHIIHREPLCSTVSRVLPKQAGSRTMHQAIPNRNFISTRLWANWSLKSNSTVATAAGEAWFQTTMKLF